MRSLVLFSVLFCASLARQTEKKQWQFLEYFQNLSPEEQAYAAGVASAYAEEAFADEFEEGVENAKKEASLKRLLSKVEGHLETKRKAQYAARSQTQYYLNDLLGARQWQFGPAYDSLTPEQQEYANSVATEYFAESFADEFADDVDNAKKRSVGTPNVIFFLIDDLGSNDVPWTNPEVHAPYMMDLATNGVILDNYYAQPVCSPSRGAVMTGNYAWHNGMQHDVIAYTVPECAPKDLQFISEKLKGAGYATHAIGKWHLGFCDVECTPTYRGFDTFFGFYQGYIDHYTHMVAHGYDWWDNVAGAGEKSRMDLQGQYAGDLLTERAVELINNHDASTPMYMYFAHSSVHTPIQAPDKYTSQYPDLDHHRATYLGMVTGLDDTIQQVTEALKAKGMYDNTVIIFTSDNGAEFHAGSNGNLRGSKTTFYEAGIKVPGFIHSPLVTAPGRSTELMHISDWHATILSMVGLDTSGIDGLDQSALLFNGGSSARDEIIFQIDSTFPQFLGAEAIRVGDYKLLRGFPGLYDGYESDGSLGFTHVVDLMSKRSFSSHLHNSTLKQHHEELKRGNYNFDWGAIAAYIKSVANTVQLYNVVDDPEERTNLADSDTGRVAEMVAKLDAGKATERIPDLSMQIPIQAGDSSNFGGIWTPGWC